MDPAGGVHLVGRVPRDRGDVGTDEDGPAGAVDEPRHLGDVRGQQAVALLAGPQRRLGTHATDGHAGDAARALDQLPVGIGRTPGGAVVHGERGHRGAGRVEHRHGPARAQPVRQRQLALVAPAGVGGDVLDDHRLALREGQAGGAAAGSADDPVHHGHVAGGQARRRAVTQAIALHQEDRAVHPFALRLDGAAERVEHGGERLAGRDHLQHPLLAGQQRLGPLALGDVHLEAVQPVPAERHAVADPDHPSVGGLHPVLAGPSRGRRRSPGRSRRTRARGRRDERGSARSWGRSATARRDNPAASRRAR